MTLTTRVLLVTSLVAGAACGDKKPDPVAPVAGDLTVGYTGSGQADGAMLVTVTGVVTAVKAVGNLQVASAPLGPTSTRVVVTGDISPGDLFKIAVADVGTVSTYSARIDAVADRNTFALGDPFSYTATVRR